MTKTPKKKAAKKKHSQESKLGQSISKLVNHPHAKNFRRNLEETMGTAKPAPKVKENSLWSWFWHGVASALANWRGENRAHMLHMVRIENESATFVDVEGCYEGVGFVAELKTIARPEQKGKKEPSLTLSHFTTSQALFLQARADAGERAWLFVQVGDTRYLIHASVAHRFLKPFKESELAKAATEPLCGDTAMDYLLTMVGK